ncbi:hypothetical protein NQZ68_032250 [Dissostichus eleginoides]|nr:hypothetical protein NQZ68_032250 [Dissostichus eleginoides]
MAESAITFEGWRYAHYFEFVRRIDRNVTVRCKLCPGQKLLSTAVNTTSNLNKHLQRTHAKVKLIAKDPKPRILLFSVPDRSHATSQHKQQSS